MFSLPSRVFTVVTSLFLLGAAALGWMVLESHAEESSAFVTSSKAPTEPMEKVNKSEQEWKKLLSPEQFYVTRQSGTERPNGKIYKEFEQHGAGAYHCVCCGNLLFTSKEKFHSGCGWPSFYDPAKATGVVERRDDSAGMTRIEVVCSRCDAHLGHVFEGEGFPTPTNRRFCINGVALTFVPNESSDSGKPSADEMPTHSPKP